MDVISGQFCIPFVLEVSPVLAVVYSFLPISILVISSPHCEVPFMLVLDKDRFIIQGRISLAFSSAACSQTCKVKEKEFSFIQLREQKHCLPSSSCILRVIAVSSLLQWSSLLRVAEQALGTFLLFCCSNRNVIICQVNGIQETASAYHRASTFLLAALECSQGRHRGVLQTQG